MRRKNIVLVLAIVSISIRLAYVEDIHEQCLPQTSQPTSSSELLYESTLGRAPRYEDPESRNSTQVAADPAAVLCPPQILVKRPLCGKLDFTTPTNGHIFFDAATGHYSYEPDSCVLRRLPADQALRCLAKEGPLLFLGDSLTRYQFLTLAHFLAAGLYQHPFDGPGSLSNANSQDPGQSGNKFDKLWKHAVQEVHAHAGHAALKVKHSRTKHIEQAHLQLDAPLPNGSAANPRPRTRQANVYYYNMNAGGPKAVGRALDWALEQRQDFSYVVLNVCAHHHGAVALDGSGTVKHEVKHGEGAHASKAEADASEAASPPPPWGVSLVSDVTQSLEQAAGRLPESTQLIWKSCTTPVAEFRAEVDEAEAAIRRFAQTAGVAVYDIRRVSMAALDQRLVPTWYNGSMHFMQFMYEQFNDLLLNILCD